MSAQEPKSPGTVSPQPKNFKDIETRSVTRMNGSAGCLGVNLSKIGCFVLEVDETDKLDLHIYENGIWIPKDQ